jgi:hypothetical protein
MNYPTIISYSNFGYLDFAKNLIINLSKTIKNHKIHFYCLDIETYISLLSLKISQIDIKYELLEQNTSKNFEKYGTTNYNKITHTKVDILKKALEQYNFIHFIDSDVVCINEPLYNHYDKYKDYDIMFQYDAGFHSVDRPHASTIHHIWACTGNITLKNTKGTKYILDKIVEYQIKYQNKNDQECLYEYFKDCNIADIRDYTSARLISYNVDEYTNGFWLNNNIGTLNNTYFFHANHVSGKNAKINLLKKAQRWYL